MLCGREVLGVEWDLLPLARSFLLFGQTRRLLHPLAVLDILQRGSKVTLKAVKVRCLSF